MKDTPLSRPSYRRDGSLLSTPLQRSHNNRLDIRVGGAPETLSHPLSAQYSIRGIGMRYQRRMKRPYVDGLLFETQTERFCWIHALKISLGFVNIEIAESLVISRAYRNNYDLHRDNTRRKALLQ